MLLRGVFGAKSGVRHLKTKSAALPLVKQSYQVEYMRTLTMTRLRNLAYPPKHVVRVAKRCSGRGALVLAVAYFVMVWIGKSERCEVLRTHIVETAKRIYGAPEFFYYAHPC